MFSVALFSMGGATYLVTFLGTLTSLLPYTFVANFLAPGDNTPPASRLSVVLFERCGSFLVADTTDLFFGLLWDTFLAGLGGMVTIPSVDFGTVLPIGPSMAATSAAPFNVSHSSALPAGLVNTTFGDLWTSF